MGAIVVARYDYRSGIASKFDSSLDPALKLRELRVDNTSYFIHVIQKMHPPYGRDSVLLGYEVDGKRHRFGRIPLEDDVFAWVSRQQLRHPDDRVFVLIAGEWRELLRAQLREIDTAKMVGPVWCPVGNIVAERPYGPGGAEMKRGSKHFAPGAKLYYRSGFGGWGFEDIEVVGRHRATHRYVTMVIKAAWVTNWHVELAYSPRIISELWPMWDGSQRSKIEALELIEIVRGYAPEQTSQ